MKKVVLSLALVAMMSVSFVSCKDTKTEETVVTEETTTTTEEVPAEEIAPVVADTVSVEETTTTTPAN